MGTEIKVVVLDRKTITPSSPTPDHLRSLNLSVFDQMSPEFACIPLLLFYSSNNDEMNIDHRSLAAKRSTLLETSLSKTLTQFYPFAGKFNNNASISCNDHGAAFVQAHVNCTLSNISRKVDYGVLHQLLPSVSESTKEIAAGHLLLVQANFFDCGGMAIGVKISHKVADAFTLCTFIKGWAAVAFGSSTDDQIALSASEFGVAASLWPPLGIFNSPAHPIFEYANKVKCVVKRFVFEASKIDALKSKAANCFDVPNPTRVEVVSALIWKCAIEASRSNNSYVRSSVWYQAVNMRKVLGQPSLMGNVVGLFGAKSEESEANYQSLIARLRGGIEKFRAKYGVGVGGEGVNELVNEYREACQSNDMDICTCSSWCRFPFYEANFGWGMPSRVSSILGMELQNIIFLIDTRDGGGIEATMSFKEEDMALIETNEELLAYASLNPAII